MKVSELYNKICGAMMGHVSLLGNSKEEIKEQARSLLTIPTFIEVFVKTVNN